MSDRVARAQAHLTGAQPTPALPDVPEYQFATTTHVGTLNPNDRKEWSMEGDGLSVSNAPNEWRRILGLRNEPQWTLSRKDGQPLRFINAHDFPHYDKVTDWGVQMGLGEKITVYEVTYFDDNTMEEDYARFASEDAALDFIDEQGDGDYIEVEEAFRFYPDKAPRGGELTNAEETLLTMWADRNTDYDGVWWNDSVEESEWTAPRGVILPSRLGNMTYTQD